MNGGRPWGSRAGALVCLLASCRDPSSAPINATLPEPRPQPLTSDTVARSLELERRCSSLERLCSGLERLCPSLGAFQRLGAQRLYHDGPQLRATVPSSRGDSAALTFRFLGRSAQTAALGSGERREQIGLKLLAQDSCNVAYVMWRFGDPPSVVASWKSNPGTRHAQCGNRGYQTLRPVWSAPVARPVPGSSHELSARIEGGFLHASIDARPVLRAALVPGMLAGVGEVGLRSDNLRYEVLRFEAILPETGAAPLSPGCPPGSVADD